MFRDRPSLSILLLSIHLVWAIGAALAEKDVDGLEDLLPHHETIAERQRWLGRESEMPGLWLRADPPPTAPIRNCAEWEPCTGVMIRYPLGLPYTLLRDFDDDVTLHVVVSSSYQAMATSNLTANGVDMAKVEFLVRNNESIWTRDYGPWFVFDGNNDLLIIDHTYNRPWRPNDNLIPVYFGSQQGIPVVSHDMFHTGGNYMTDGAHVSSSTRLVYDEAASNNGMTEADVDQLMSDYYGLASYQVLEYIESGGIHHIDTWAKFLDEETVLVKEVWSSHWTYATLNQRATLLASLPASTGRNYQVHRVYCYDIGGSSPASYTNSLILNDNIYVPLFGNTTYDGDAITAYQNAAPGYTVRGYEHTGWLSDDALHCRAKGVMDRGMLRIAHVPIVAAQSGDVLVTAQVFAHSGDALTGVDLHYQQNGAGWSSAAMSSAGGDTYEATIPEPPTAGTTKYYIAATDAGGRSAEMPRVAPAHWYDFAHDPDLTDATELDAPQRLRVIGHHPNPFNPRTTFAFELLHADHVRLDVVDARGRIVRRLSDEMRPSGWNEIVWNGRDDDGAPLAAGIYLFRLRAAGLQYIRKATLVK